MIGIYKIQNKINNKIYIGQSVDISRRDREHKNKSFDKNSSDYNSAIGRAIRKYGYENFSFETIEECSIEELNDKERYWISYYNSYENGYNLTLGGTEGFSIQQYLPVYQYDLEGNFLNTFTNVHEAASVLNISSHSIQNNLLNKTKSCNGFIWSYNKTEKIKNGFSNIPVIAFTFEGEKYKTFPSISMASKETGDTQEVIKSSCENNEHTGKYYQYRYWIDNENLNNIPVKKNYQGRGVNQYDINGTFIQTFKSISQAAKAVGIKNHSSIRGCCEKKKGCYTSGGFLWSYYGDVPNIPNKIKPKSIKIQQYDLNNNLINTYPSVRKAAESLGNVCYRKQIIQCCEGILTNYKNFIWRYSE